MKRLTTFIIALAVFVALTGVAQAGPDEVIVTVDNVPDAATTFALMGIALAGLAAVRRFVR